MHYTCCQPEAILKTGWPLIIPRIRTLQLGTKCVLFSSIIQIHVHENIFHRPKFNYNATWIYLNQKSAALLPISVLHPYWHARMFKCCFPRSLLQLAQPSSYIAQSSVFSTQPLLPFFFFLPANTLWCSFNNPFFPNNLQQILLSFQTSLNNIYIATLTGPHQRFVSFLKNPSSPVDLFRKQIRHSSHNSSTTVKFSTNFWLLATLFI